MNVLCHGIPFCCDNTPLELYVGKHDIRSFGIHEDVDFRYDPLTETASEIIERISREWKLDLILFWVPEMQPPPVGIEDEPVRTVALVSDWNLYYPLLAMNLARYDLVLCDKPGLAVFESEWVHPQHLFPLYSQISTLHKPYPVAKDIDIVFAGNLNPAAHLERGRYLERLAALSERYRVVIASNILGEDYGRLLSRARIVFNHSIRGELNLRVFETLACGSLAFLEEKNREVHDWFEDGRDVVLYNETNFETRLAHYLEHPDEAEAVAMRGHARANEFAGENRFDQLVDWAMAQPVGSRRFFDLPIEEQRYQTLMMYAGARYPVYHTLEEQLVSEVATLLPRDPRAWSAIGNHMLKAYSRAGDDQQRQDRAIKAFVRAQQLSPDSAPHAFNVATVARAYGVAQTEAEYLECVLQCNSMAGAESVLGMHEDIFWGRWRRGVAEQTATLDMLKAEAHIRLATICARGELRGLVEEHLVKAKELDPANAGGALVFAELLWASGRKEEAAEALKSSLAYTPLNSSARNRLAAMLDALGRREEAEELARLETAMRRACVTEPPAQT